MPLPTDPEFVNQWHLNNTTPGLLDLNILGVWDPTQGPAYTGAGITTVVIDDGFDYLHTDLAPNYDDTLDWDYANGDANPFGLSTNSHGTSVAGIIGAAANDDKTVGIAYDSTLIGFQVDQYISNTWLDNIALAIADSATSADADTVNISQGIANDYDSIFGIGYSAASFADIKTAIGTAVDTGRGGLGVTIVKSAGNSRSDNYDVNADDWTNDTRQVVVAAVDQDGGVSSYSSFGAAVLVSGFGTPGEVVTTDRSGAAGYNGTDINPGFNGTSAAAPMVTGVVNLMLEANDGLGWRDVQTILANSARHVGSNVGAGPTGDEKYAWDLNGAQTWNGGGMHFSNDYGYGLVDGLAAVRMAESWFLTGTPAATSANETSASVDMLDATEAIPAGPAGNTYSDTIAQDLVVERVTVTLDWETTWVGDVRVIVTSPDGTESILLDNVGVTGSWSLDYNGYWTFETQAFRGEHSDGTWSVQVVDSNSLDLLTVRDVVVTVHGSLGVDDRYVFTDEFSDFLPPSLAITDMNGGIDTLNAAAVTSNSVIRLDGPGSMIDGVSGLTFTNIEHAIGGDGDDDILGNAADNRLFGMRGNDMLNGLGGNDTMAGGTGDDSYAVDSFSDVVIEEAGEGTDTIVFALGAYSIFSRANIENLFAFLAIDTEMTGNSNDNEMTGNGGNDDMNGSGGNDTLIGNGGNDTLNGGSGVDSMEGGSGDDTYILDNFSDVVVEHAGEGVDTIVIQRAAYSIFSLAAIENLTAGAGVNTTLTGNTGNNVLTGNVGNDTLIASGGNDTLDGGTGADRLEGGSGNDVYYIDNYGDQIIEYAGGGLDTAMLYVTSFSIFSRPDVENITGMLSVNHEMTGNSANNVLTGNSGNDSMNGSGGNDTLIGNHGADLLNGGSGDDSLIGGWGDDTYILDNFSDVVVEHVGQGYDTIVIQRAAYSIFTQTNIENLTAGAGVNTTLTGNTGNNVLTGNVGNDTLIASGGHDTLDGGTGADRLEGGSGNDVYHVDNYGDGVFEYAGGGTDTVMTSLSSFSIFSRVHVENITGTSASGHTFTGNSAANVLTGHSGNDSMNGSGGNDTIIGNQGADTLNGGSGDDSLIGGWGDDTYIVDDYGDRITEHAGQGWDTVRTSLSTYSVFSQPNVEHIVATSGIDHVFTGNTGANRLTGNIGDDDLNASGGNDTLIGGAGDDTLTGGSGADIFVFDVALGAGNVDSITDFSSVHDLFHLDDAVFAGIGAIGTLSAAAFTIGTAAVSAATRIIYDSATGDLFFDADGTGGAAQLQFATLVNNAAIGAADFEIV